MQKASKAAHTVVFLRHGQSVWNLENRFTGWYDVDLTANGVQEAIAAGQALKEKNFKFDIAYTSVLQRAIKTNHNVLTEMGQLYIPHHKSWRLNERHYGSLQGLNKVETAEKHGEEKVLQWRRSYDIPPPQLEMSDERHPMHDDCYRLLPPSALPCSESLATTLDRVMPYWNDTICPQVMDGKNAVIVAHGNSIRAIVKELTGMDNNEILGYNVPTAVPLIFEFDKEMKAINNYYLMDAQELAERQEAVAKQGSVKH